MTDRETRDVLVLKGCETSAALALLVALEADSAFRVTRMGEGAIEPGSDTTERWSCVLWLTHDFDALPRGRASEIVDHFAPAPVVVLVNVAPSDQMRAVSAGAEDCIVADLLQPASLWRIVSHAAERASNRMRLQAAERKYLDLYDNTPVMMLSLESGSGVISSANRYFFEHLGMARAEVIGQPMRSILVGDDRDDALRESARRLSAGMADKERAVTVRRGGAAADAEPIEALYSATPVFDAHGNVAGANATLIDVTDRNRAARERDALQGELQLAQKLESIGQLAAGIAHEINTPAQYLSDNLSFVRESFDDLCELLAGLPETIDAIAALPGGASVAASLRNACEAADLDYVRDEIPNALREGHEGIGKIREIVLALKDFSHPGGEDKESADLNRIIESTTTVARNEWKYVADVQLDLDPALPTISCFPNSLAQVVLNLVVNAAHAIADDPKRAEGSKGTICITSRAGDAHTAIVEIGDDGPGIAEAHLGKIFDPFFTTKELGRGTGQGLAISHSVITEKHGGKLAVDTQVGTGTVFRIELPLTGVNDAATGVAA